MHAQVAGLVLGHDQVVAQDSVFHHEAVERSPVLARLDQGEAKPSLPEQRRHPVHWACEFHVTGQWHAAEDLADAPQAVCLWLIQEGRHLLDMTGHQQETLAALRQAGDFAAVMHSLRHGVAVMGEQFDDLVQQVPAASGQAWHVLEHDQADRVVLPGLEHQPDAAQGQLIEGLVLGGKAHRLRQQAAGPLAWAGDEDGVRILVAGSAADVVDGGLTPAGRGLHAIEGDVLLAGEQVEQGALGAGELLEVGQACGVDINPADAAPIRLHVAHHRVAVVETSRPGPQAAAESEMLEHALKHRPPPPSHTG
ncbi:hypothetical protein D9M69_481810 [compost metagenome]